MLNSYFVIERRGRFAVSLESDYQIWASILSRALRFNTYLEAEEMLPFCKNGAKIVLKSAPAIPAAPISKLTKTESLSELAPSIAAFNEKLEKNEDITRYWDMIPEDMRSFDIFQYIPDGIASDPGPMPEEF